MIAFKVPNLEVDKSDKFFTHWCAPAVACPASAQAAYQVIHLPERVRRKPRPSLHRACVEPQASYRWMLKGTGSSDSGDSLLYKILLQVFVSASSEPAGLF